MTNDGYQYRRIEKTGHSADPHDSDRIDLLSCPDCSFETADRKELIDHCNFQKYFLNADHRSFSELEAAEQDPVWYIAVKNRSGGDIRYHTRLCGAITPGHTTAEVECRSRQDTGLRATLCERCVDGPSPHKDIEYRQHGIKLRSNGDAREKMLKRLGFEQYIQDESEEEAAD